MTEDVAARIHGAPPAGGPASRHEGEPRRTVPILGSSLREEEYLARVREAMRLIEIGELYQVNLSQRLELPAPADPLELAAALARVSPAPFAAWLDAGSFQVVSASPERFLSLKGRRVESRPIKGTRPRGRTPAEDAALRDELIGSAKDRAENVMIADLLRNDLGRVCEAGSIRCEAICRPETYASVHHLVSVVSGELREDRGRADLLRAVFPGGSMTGAPKVRAMQAIEDLEPVPRGVYSGAMGYLSFCGAIDLSIVIRTIIVARGASWLQVGGGVVTDSVPAAEYRESLDKAESVMRGLAATAWRA
jgi:para-aminobenzoate synthetase component 1